MKRLLLIGLILSLSAFGANSTSQGAGYVPNDGTARPGNPGTGLGKSAPATTGTGTDVNGADTMGGSSSPSTAINPSSTSDNSAAETLQTGTTDAAVQDSVRKANTAVTPVPEDTDDLTLKGKTQTGPYRTPGMKQSQEAEELDYRAIPKVDHDKTDASENQ